MAQLSIKSVHPSTKPSNGCPKIYSIQPSKPSPKSFNNTLSLPSISQPTATNGSEKVHSSPQNPDHAGSHDHHQKTKTSLLTI
mmetsp:Transcript_8027/g.11598  ORF Transcript_8027/g.11598 Transcript_8027/m.11598 type:complete len:83 (-) Transcript_8027:147-395(-)